jgi:hypothetical protein
MIVNLKSCKITKQLSNAGTEYEQPWLVLAVQPEGEAYALTPYIAREHVDFLLRGLLGKLERMEGDRPILDGTYLVQPYTDGLYIKHFGGGSHSAKPLCADPDYPNYMRLCTTVYEYSIRFPGKILAQYIEAVGWPLRGAQPQSVEIPAEVIAQAKEDYRPRVALAMAETTRTQLRAMLRGPNAASLNRSLASPVRIARNCSDGDVVSVQLYPDSEESFYWEIWKKGAGQRNMNGGIILHKHEGHEEYSVHT